MKAHIKIEFDLDTKEYRSIDGTEAGINALVRLMLSRKADFPDAAFGGIKVELSGCPNDTDGDDRCGHADCPYCREDGGPIDEAPDEGDEPSSEAEMQAVKEKIPIPVCHACQRPYGNVPDEEDGDDEPKVCPVCRLSTDENVRSGFDVARQIGKDFAEFKQKCQGLVKKWRDEAAERGPVTRQTWRGAAAELEKAILEKDSNEVENPHGFL